MTCVLSMSSIYNNPCGGFGGSKDDVTTDTDYDYGWLSAAPPSSRLSDNTACSCRFDNNNSTMCRTTSVLDSRLSLDASQKHGGKTDGNQHDTDLIFDDKRSMGVKRKLDNNDFDELLDRLPPKRISPFLNTPKERKEERRKVLKMSVQKLRKMEDPEHFLCRSVLINNTLKKVQKEIREEKQKSHQGYKSCIYRLRPTYDVLNKGYLHSSSQSQHGYVSVYDDPFVTPGDNDKLSDDITDSLVESIEEKTVDVTSRDHLSTDHTQSKEKQMCTEMDTVFNNLIRALGES
ncbi:hypothetical protein KUTeg_012940 [Tegillarca granosa]|uniref:SERTA domain-containing protein n=1 Tax=Tegillarca granosa TaxID=220873 RepID=A0ABQ9EVR8_TEGGR|nr:hypothetical protein KUTeg_012940 [Tegillarca granosa]